MSGAEDADLSTLQDPTQLDSNQRRLFDRRWSWLRQVHSDRVVRADRPGGGAGSVGDALVTAQPDVLLAVQVADCVPVGFMSEGGAFAVAHAGWRGALGGVLESAVRSLRAIAPGQRVDAVVGTHICAACYEFGPADLETMQRRFGSGVKSVSATGTPSLDMSVVVTAELDRLGIPIEATSAGCTSCSAGYWSHRARAERGRQALIGIVT